MELELGMVPRHHPVYPRRHPDIFPAPDAEGQDPGVCFIDPETVFRSRNRPGFRRVDGVPVQEHGNERIPDRRVDALCDG